jgi:hypothetical protein
MRQSSPGKKPASKKAPEMTSGQKNALESARGYVDMSGFSKRGLIKQLSSSAGDGYSKADATFAANNADADWKAEAVESAQNHLDMGGFSEQALIEQLSSAARSPLVPRSRSSPEGRQPPRSPWATRRATRIGAA